MMMPTANFNHDSGTWNGEGNTGVLESADTVGLLKVEKSVPVKAQPRIGCSVQPRARVSE